MVPVGGEEKKGWARGVLSGFQPSLGSRWKDRPQREAGPEMAQHEPRSLLRKALRGGNAARLPSFPEDGRGRGGYTTRGVLEEGEGRARGKGEKQCRQSARATSGKRRVQFFV